MKTSNVFPMATMSMLVVFMALLVQHDSLSEGAALKENSNAKVASKENDRFTTSGLKLQFSDDFNKEYGIRQLAENRHGPYGTLHRDHRS